MLYSRSHQSASVTRDVVIDITRLLGRYFNQRRPTGVDRVTLAYVQHYGPMARAMFRWRGRSGLFSGGMSKRVFDMLLRWNLADVSKLRCLVALGVLSCIGRGDAKGAVLLHTGHNDAELPSLWRNMRWHKLRPVFFVHDLIPLTHPQYCRAGEAERHTLRLLSMLRGQAIVVNSNDTLAQLARFAKSQGLSLPAHCVALLAPAQQLVAQLVKQLVKQSVAEESVQPYFLMVGTIEPRKNHSLILRVWALLLEQWPLAQVPRLVVLGQTGWQCADIEAQLRNTAQYQGRVQWIQQCNDVEMAQLMAGACALVFPSHVEGFGIPAVEALIAGTPVIASDLPVFRESVGRVPEYLPTDDVGLWAAHIMHYAAPGSLQRAAQLQRMLGWQAPTWAEHFRHVDALLAQLVA